MTEDIASLIKEHQKDIDSLLNDEEVLIKIKEAIILISQAFLNDQKVLFCGNGGSAADAQHLAGELSGRFKLERPALFAEALHVNIAALTAISNDYSFESALSRLLQSKGKQNDILVALSTSGSSANILKAMKTARKLSMKVIGLSGNYNSPFSGLCDIDIKIHSKNTPRIQEAMMLIGHIICEKVEQNLFS